MKNIEFNTQICTTIEQSKRLLELGLNTNIADMSWTLAPISSEYPHASLIPYSKTMNRLTYNILPAWSLHRLMEIGNITYVGFLEIDSIYEVCIETIASKIRFKRINPEYLKEELRYD